MEEGSTGKNPYGAVKKSSSNDQPTKPSRGMGSAGRRLKAFHGKFQQPGDKQGTGIGSEEEKEPEQIGAPLLYNISIETRKLADRYLSGKGSADLKAVFSQF